MGRLWVGESHPPCPTIAFSASRERAKDMDETLINDYLKRCKCERRLDEKTVRAYRCDLEQFYEWVSQRGNERLSRETLHAYLAYLNSRYAPASAKRKLAALRAFMSWAVDEGAIERSPFEGMRVKLREPRRLPRTIPLADLNRLFGYLYDSESTPAADSFSLARDRAIIEMLIATGVRVSELCSLDVGSIDTAGRLVRIAGKGNKERCVQIEVPQTILAIEEYLRVRTVGKRVAESEALFLNRWGKRMSDRAVREMVDRRARNAGLATHVTPHMFRHTFATLLLEGDVDIRYIQRLLGHSSISTTEIYAHVTSAKLREIMRENNPRNVIGA